MRIEKHVTELNGKRVIDYSAKIYRDYDPLKYKNHDIRTKVPDALFPIALSYLEQNSGAPDLGTLNNQRNMVFFGNLKQIHNFLFSLDTPVIYEIIEQGHISADKLFDALQSLKVRFSDKEIGEIAYLLMANIQKRQHSKRLQHRVSFKQPTIIRKFSVKKDPEKQPLLMHASPEKPSLEEVNTHSDQYREFSQQLITVIDQYKALGRSHFFFSKHPSRAEQIARLEGFFNQSDTEENNLNLLKIAASAWHLTEKSHTPHVFGSYKTTSRLAGALNQTLLRYTPHYTPAELQAAQQYTQAYSAYKDAISIITTYINEYKNCGRKYFLFKQSSHRQATIHDLIKQSRTSISLANMIFDPMWFRDECLRLRSLIQTAKENVELDQQNINQTKSSTLFHTKSRLANKLTTVLQLMGPSLQALDNLPTQPKISV